VLVLAGAGGFPVLLLGQSGIRKVLGLFCRGFVATALCALRRQCLQYARLKRPMFPEISAALKFDSGVWKRMGTKF
jgi:hypothetical protein